MWSPILLRDAVDLTVSPMNTFGAVASMDQRKFVNPNRSPMLIDQFRFYPDMAAFYASSSNQNPLAAFWVELKLGSISLTRQFIPLGALAPRYNGLTTVLSEGSAVTQPGGRFPYLDTVFTWHLPEPLYVPPGVAITGRWLQQRIVTTDSTPIAPAQLSMSIAGRSLPQDYPIPEEIAVPWASATVCFNQAVASFVSNDADLANPYDTPFKLHQMLGLNVASSDSSFTGPNAANRNGITVQVTSSSGKMVIRDPTPFQLLFPACRGVLDMKAELQPGEFWRAEFEALPPMTTAAQTSPQTVEFTALSLIGTRKLKTPRAVMP